MSHEKQGLTGLIGMKCTLKYTAAGNSANTLSICTSDMVVSLRWMFVSALTVQGPIVRVNPSELHIDDPSFYDQLYNFGPELDRPRNTFGMSSPFDAIFLATDTG